MHFESAVPYWENVWVPVTFSIFVMSGLYTLSLIFEQIRKLHWTSDDVVFGRESSCLEKILVNLLPMGAFYILSFVSYPTWVILFLILQDAFRNYEYLIVSIFGRLHWLFLLTDFPKIFKLLSRPYLPLHTTERLIKYLEAFDEYEANTNRSLLCRQKHTAAKTHRGYKRTQTNGRSIRVSQF